jgi:hypothetical protein
MTPDATCARARAVELWRDLKSPRLGMRGYLCVLGFLAAGPATSVDVAEAFDTTRQRARELLWRMAELGMVHTAGTRRVSRAGPAVALWGYGPGAVERKGIPSRERFPELVQLRAVLQAFEEPAQVKRVAEAVGSGYMVVMELIRIARNLGLCHVFDWDCANANGSGVQVPSFVMGAGCDARKPRRMGAKVARQRCNAGKRAKAQTLLVLRALASNSDTERLAA